MFFFTKLQEIILENIPFSDFTPNVSFFKESSASSTGNRSWYLFTLQSKLASETTFEEDLYFFFYLLKDYHPQLADFLFVQRNFFSLLLSFFNNVNWFILLRPDLGCTPEAVFSRWLYSKNLVYSTKETHLVESASNELAVNFSNFFFFICWFSFLDNFDRRFYFSRLNMQLNFLEIFYDCVPFFSDFEGFSAIITDEANGFRFFPEFNFFINQLLKTSLLDNLVSLNELRGLFELNTGLRHIFFFKFPLQFLPFTEKIVFLGLRLAFLFSWELRLKFFLFLYYVGTTKDYSDLAYLLDEPEIMHAFLLGLNDEKPLDFFFLRSSAFHYALSRRSRCFFKIYFPFLKKKRLNNSFFMKKQVSFFGKQPIYTLYGISHTMISNNQFLLIKGIEKPNNFYQVCLFIINKNKSKFFNVFA